jgi:menaquinone-dependent protoporphyrinogen oxidase
VLVVYASKYGSVEEVARFVGGRLRRRGAECDVVDARTVDDITGYELVVLGGGLSMAKLHADAGRFLERHHEALAERHTAVFAMGPLSAEAEEIDKVRPQLDKALRRYPDIEPCAVEVFGGVIRKERLRFPFNRMPEGDHRDRSAIERFADTLPAGSPVVYAGA